MRWRVLTMLAVLGLSGPAAAQTAPGTRAEDAIAALAAEFRALRAELAETARASLRLQVLTARLQAQEQRIIHLDRQRSESTARRAQTEQMRAMTASQLGQFDAMQDAAKATSPEERRAIEQMLRETKERLAQQDETLQQLRLEENEAQNALAQEQGRWSDLNARLDELERSLGR